MIQTGGTVDLHRSVGLHRSADLYSRVPNAVTNRCGTVPRADGKSI